MKLIVLGSSSKGNGYILTNGKETLLLETGVALSEVKKALNFDISSIVGALVTHEHKDHAGRVDEYMKAGIDIYCSMGTFSTAHHRIKCVNNLHSFFVGNFTIVPFDVKHDAREPFGYVISHPETGDILFITDSYYTEYTFKNLSQIIIEVNFDNEILDANISKGKIPVAVRNRILSSHMSLNTALDLLDANDLSKVNNIVLIHLSDGNSHAENFKQTIEKATGKTVTIADKGIEINLNKTPF